MKKNIAKGKMTEQERADVNKRVRPVTALSEFANVDFVVEAVSESPALKQTIFGDLSKVLLCVTGLSSTSCRSIAICCCVLYL